MAGLAAVAGLLAFGVSSAGAFALTQRTDPSLGTLERNRYIVAGVAAAAGLGMAAFLPSVALLGVGIAAGGVAALAGTQLTLAIGRVVDKPALPSGQTTAGVFGPNGRQQFGAVLGPGGRQQFGGLGAVLGPGGRQTFGDLDDDGYFGG